MTDHEIIEAFAHSDSNRVRDFYREHKGLFIATLRKNYPTLQEEDCQDAYQTTMLRLQENILSRRLTCETLNTSFKNYLLGIGRNVAREILHDKGLLAEETAAETPDNDTEPNPLEVVIDNERKRIIQDAVKAMQSKCTDILLGYYWENKSLEQLAAQLGYNNALTAKNIKARCLAKLRNYITNRFREL